MKVVIKPTLTVDVDHLIEQRDLLGKLVSNLESGSTGTLGILDTGTLLGILDILYIVSDDAKYMESVDSDEVSDLARRVVKEWDIDSCMQYAEDSLIDFWSSKEGAEDYARCTKEYN